MKSNILWVTSFNEQLYEASGKNLMSSFLKYSIDNNLFIGNEGNFLYTVNLIKTINITNHILLTEFLDDNKDIIPISLGGEAEPCKCKDPWTKKEKYHIKDCQHTWFRRNAFRWYRKYVTLVEAFKYAKDKDFDYIIWIDCDCVFTKKISYSFIANLFEHNTVDLIYLKGPKRPVLEAGFVAYNNKANILESMIKLNNACTTGQLILSSILHKYRNKEFRLYDRWDDCYILQKIIGKLEKNGIIISKDIGKDISGSHSDIFTNSVIGPYITHNKGLHGRKLGIMK